MITIEHGFIIINMFVIIEFYHSGPIQSLVEGYLHLIYTSAFLYWSPWHSILIMDSFDKLSLSLCWCRYAQILPVALL